MAQPLATKEGVTLEQLVLDSCKNDTDSSLYKLYEAFIDKLPHYNNLNMIEVVRKNWNDGVYADLVKQYKLKHDIFDKISFEAALANYSEQLQKKEAKPAQQQKIHSLS